MKPVTAKGAGCLQSCIASLLELSLEDVPDFTAVSESYATVPPHWFLLQSFLNSRGCIFLEIALPKGTNWMLLPFGVYCVLFGHTRSAIKHAVVGKASQEDFIHVFDPHPETGGILSAEAVGFIVPRDPARMTDEEKVRTIGIGMIERRNAEIEALQKEVVRLKSKYEAPIDILTHR